MPDRIAARQGERIAPWVALALLATLLLAGCSALAPSGPTAFLGRYQRIGEGALIGEPDFLAADGVEFRVGGQAVSLLYDVSTRSYFRSGMWRYRILDNGRIEATGRCWRGAASFDCTHSYNARLSDGVLTLSDRADPARRNQYTRLGDAPSELPPVIAVPSATPKP